MDNYSKIMNHNVESINDAEFFENIPNEVRELFKRDLSEAMDTEIHEI